MDDVAPRESVGVGCRVGEGLTLLLRGNRAALGVARQEPEPGNPALAGFPRLRRRKAWGRRKRRSSTRACGCGLASP